MSDVDTYFEMITRSLGDQRAAVLNAAKAIRDADAEVEANQKKESRAIANRPSKHVGHQLRQLQFVLPEDLKVRDTVLRDVLDRHHCEIISLQ